MLYEPRRAAGVAIELERFTVGDMQEPLVGGDKAHEEASASEQTAGGKGCVATFRTKLASPQLVLVIMVAVGLVIGGAVWTWTVLSRSDRDRDCDSYTCACGEAAVGGGEEDPMHQSPIFIQVRHGWV